MKFTDLGLIPEILKAVSEKGYETPSPIQAKAIAPIIEGRDVMAAAQTGTGKTAGFTLPMLHNLASGNKVRGNQVRALVLTPTRELAAQVAENVEQYSQYLPIRSDVVFGGVKINPQMQRLRRGTDVLVATPGRLIDLYNQNALKFDQLEVLVLDEADRMLDMGFIHDIRRILKVLPNKRQNLMFSATFSNEIRSLAKTIVNNPVEVSVAPPNTTAEKVVQWLIPSDKAQKPALLAHVIKSNNWSQVLVFSRTKHGANKLVRKLEQADVSAMAIHGNKSQAARTKALAAFKDESVRVLVATDIAARGIDIAQLPHVINYDLPNVAEDYVHRIGRTARAGASGEAVSFVMADEIEQLKAIERLIGTNIERKTIDEFAPEKPLPETPYVDGPQKPKKPKKPKATKAPGDRGDSAGRPAQNANNRKPGGQRRPSNGKPGGGKPTNGEARRRRPKPAVNANR